MYYSDHQIKLIDFVVSVYVNYLREDIRKNLRVYTNYNKEIILKYIHYLISHGASIKNLDKLISIEKLKQLYSAIYQGLFDKSRNKLKTLSDYKGHHRKTKKHLYEHFGLGLVKKIMDKSKVNKYTAMKINSYL
jgi:hypothetical protein